VGVGVKGLAALLLVALAAAPAAVYPAAQAQEAQDPAVAAVEAYIGRVEALINRTLAIADAFNVSMPENLSALVNESLRLLEEARAALAEGNVTLALQLASEASKTFAPVFEYVWTSLSPEEKEVVRSATIEAAVQTRAMIAEKLSLMLQRMNESCGGCLPAEIRERIESLVKVAEQARLMLRQGNATGAEAMVRKFDAEAVKVMAAVKHARGQVEGVLAVAAAVKGAVAAAEAVADYINDTIRLIEANQTDAAIARLENATARLENLSVRLERIYQVAEARGVNDTYLDAIMLLYNATIDAASLVNASIYSLEQNDTETAVSYLALAVETLYNATSQVGELPLPGKVQAKLENAVKTMNAVRAKLAERAGDPYARISEWIDKLLAKLQDLLAKYEEGRVSAAKVKAEFTKAKRHLESLLDALEGKAPQELIDKIVSAIQWIEENMPSDQGSGGGPGQDNPGGGGGGGQGGQRRP